jgi:hypothetical protein
MGGISFFQATFDSTIISSTDATAVIVKQAVNAFFGPMAYWIAPPIRAAVASANDWTTVFTYTLPGMYFK